ncbi:immunoglobulin-like domain-containing protein [Brevibacillus parabrevis]|uniref:immunoglobulin-like domain-containing protein n=1 Tax=Brevibacillus parabrevis TaxID=54914 RepID=UPI001F609C5C|nr:immunoglobulin-like domain-containing protein [Brevibacillus parabrevis]
MSLTHKKAKMIKTAAIGLLAIQSLFGFAAQSHAQGPLEEINSTVDGYWYSGGEVEDGSYFEDSSNYVGLDENFGMQKAAVQFPLTQLDTSFIKAKLKLYVTNVNGDAQTVPSFTLYGSTYGAWDDDFPLNPNDPVIDSFGQNLQEGDWLEFDVTNFLRLQLEAQSQNVTFALLSNTQTGAFGFGSNEIIDGNYPRLVLEYAAKQPQVTPATTLEDTATSSGLVITPDPADASSVTHFQVSEIQGGKLYLNDGVTELTNGNFLQKADGATGLKFVPNADANTPAGDLFGFKVKAAKDANGAGLSGAAAAVITVQEVNDAPTAQNDQLATVTKGTPKVMIPFSLLTANDQAGPANEHGQTLTVADVDQAVGGTVRLVDQEVEFSLDPTFQGTASFQYSLLDDGTTSGLPASLTAGAKAEFSVEQITKPIISLVGGNTMYVPFGQSFQEPGYSARDANNNDITNKVQVTGQVVTSEPGDYDLVYNVQDDNGIEALPVTRTVSVVSHELKGLWLQEGTMTPAFQPSVAQYTLRVPNEVSSLRFRAATLDQTATLTINGAAEVNDISKEVSLNPGQNDITFIVTARNGSTKTYQLSVTRDSAPPVTPNPPTYPGHSETIPESQNHLNEQAKEVIKESVDAKRIAEQVDKSLAHLADKVMGSKLGDTEKLQLVASTSTEVLSPLVVKWKEGVVSDKQLREALSLFLEKGVNEGLAQSKLDDSEVFAAGAKLVSTVIRDVIVELEDDQVREEVAQPFREAMDKLLKHKSILQVAQHTEVADTSEQLNEVAALVQDWSQELGSKSDLFDLERHLLIQVVDEEAADVEDNGEQLRSSRAASASQEPTVLLSEELVETLANQQFAVTVMAQSGASVKLPPAFFARYNAETIAVVVEENEEATIPATFSKTSDAYDFRVFAGEKEIKSFAKGEVLIGIPYAYSSKKFTPYAYDAARKNWKAGATGKGEGYVKHDGEQVLFLTSTPGTYMLAETKLRSLAVAQRTVKLEQGATYQVQVTGALTSGRKVDLTASEDGTTYSSNKPELIEVDEEGLITVLPEAESGSKATITIQNGQSTVKMTVSVYSLDSIAVSPAKAVVYAGETLQLKVKGKYTDRSSSDITKSSMGTKYSLDDTEYAKISENGLLEVSPDAPDGTVIIITIENGDKSITYPVTVKQRA